MFTKILIANRGEIACRVATTARRMGIQTVAVHSDADAGARHVAFCDEAVSLGGTTASESYLKADEILRIALEHGAQAIHPGYGFLSENETFAQACAQAGVCFVGPPASAIAAMGSKSAAKTLMQKAGVPLVPGYHGDEQAPEFLQQQADAGIELLHPTSRPCIRAASELYCGIVDEVEAIGYDIFNKRAKTSTARRIRVAGKAYLQAISARRALN